MIAAAIRSLLRATATAMPINKASITRSKPWLIRVLPALPSTAPSRCHGPPAPKHARRLDWTGAPAPARRRFSAPPDGARRRSPAPAEWTRPQRWRTSLRHAPGNRNPASATNPVCPRGKTCRRASPARWSKPIRSSRSLLPTSGQPPGLEEPRGGDGDAEIQQAVDQRDIEQKTAFESQPQQHQHEQRLGADHVRRQDPVHGGRTGEGAPHAGRCIDQQESRQTPEKGVHARASGSNIRAMRLSSEPFCKRRAQASSRQCTRNAPSSASTVKVPGVKVTALAKTTRETGRSKLLR